VKNTNISRLDIGNKKEKREEISKDVEHKNKETRE